MFKFNFGDRVREEVTGFTGIVTRRLESASGNREYDVIPTCDEGGGTREGYWFDENRLVLVEANAVSITP